MNCFFSFHFLQTQQKKGKVATRGAKQIVEENVSTLNFYRNMVFGACGVYLTLMLVFFEFTTLTVVSIDWNYCWYFNHWNYFILFQLLTIFSGITYVACYQFMTYMAKARFTETGQILDSGVDLNMEGGIAEWVQKFSISILLGGGSCVNEFSHLGSWDYCFSTFITAILFSFT